MKATEVIVAFEDGFGIYFRECHGECDRAPKDGHFHFGRVAIDDGFPHRHEEWAPEEIAVHLQAGLEALLLEVKKVRNAVAG